MKYALPLVALGLFISMSSPIYAQAIYGPNGNYLGYSQTSPNGVTNVYNASGQNIQSFQTDNGQTNFYSSQGTYQGSSTAPIYVAPNTTINSPRQVPQTPYMKGW